MFGLLMRWSAKASLMAYNTDNFKDPRTPNSILNDKTVRTYLAKAKGFDLPLDIALPIFRWNLVFDKAGKFKRIAVYTEDAAYLVKSDDGEWNSPRKMTRYINWR